VLSQVTHDITLEPRWFCGGQRTSIGGQYLQRFIAVAWEVWRRGLPQETSLNTGKTRGILKTTVWRGFEPATISVGYHLTTATVLRHVEGGHDHFTEVDLCLTRSGWVTASLCKCYYCPLYIHRIFFIILAPFSGHGAFLFRWFLAPSCCGTAALGTLAIWPSHPILNGLN